MILSEDHSNATYQIKSFSPGKLVINDKIYTHSLIISADQLKENWPPTSAQSITNADLLQLLDFKPEIILLGTGDCSVILPAHKLAPVLEKQFHIECMSTAAAIRTYTVLISEGRQVVAGLIL